jgi:hypothetical protein
MYHAGNNLQPTSLLHGPERPQHRPLQYCMHHCDSNKLGSRALHLLTLAHHGCESFKRGILSLLIRACLHARAGRTCKHRCSKGQLPYFPLAAAMAFTSGCRLT